MTYYISAAIIAVLAAGFLLSYKKTYDILYGLIYGVKNKKIEIKDKKIERDEFRVKTSDGFLIAGYEVYPFTEAKGIIITCHNLGGSKEGMWRYVKFLCEGGYRVICFDFIDHGESQASNKLKFNHLQDLNAVVNYANDSNSNNLPIGVFGLSMGSVNGIIYAAENVNISAIVADGGPLLYCEDYLGYVTKITSIRNVFLKTIFCKMTMLITDLLEIDNRVKESLKKLKDIPILLIQGERDFINPPRNVFKAVEMIDSPKTEYWIVENANHLTSLFMAGEEYKKRVIGFFDKNLSSEENITKKRFLA